MEALIGIRLSAAAEESAEVAERAQNVGAQFEMDGQIGKGTRLQVTWQAGNR